MRISKLLLIASLGGASANACAGELGATSRGSIAITITIPPHVAVGLFAATPASIVSNDGDRLCVAAQGLDPYHVDLLGADGKPQQRAQTTSRASNGTVTRIGCVPAEAAMQTRSGPHSDVIGGPSREPVTLLIVPE